jgi:tetratricopeptide (TPR) repeat protein
MILLFVFLSIQSRTDSLEKVYAQNRQIETLLELNKCYVASGEFQRSMTLLGQNERYFRNDMDKAIILFELGNAFIFAGEIDKAHDSYLQLISRYPQFELANDAAERLYLIETVRDDPAKMRRLTNVVRLYETAQYNEAIDSARVLLKSSVDAHAYYYMALSYRGLGDLAMVLGTLEELSGKYPDNKIYEALFLQVNTYMILGEIDKARELLEDLIVREPYTIYALRARQKLEKMERVQ